MVQTVVHPLERLMTNGVFALAVLLAISTKDQVYVGALIAFMMLTSRVAAPLIQLANMLTQYDEVRLAVQTLGELVNQLPEEGRSGYGVRTPIRGRVEFADVRFRYQGTTAPALDKVSFEDPRGSVFGIMGRSGSGKTTVTRLLQSLHSNYEGLIKIDGIDMRQIRRRSSARQPRRRAAGKFPVPRHDPRDDRRRQAGRDFRRDRRAPRGSPAPRNSSSGCRAATRPISTKGRPTCRADSASGWRSRGR